MNYREAWANGEIEAGTLVDAIEELTAELADIKANRDALQLVHRVGRSLDQQRIEMAADNCEVLRARLAKYEDAEGRALRAVVLPEPMKRGDEGGSGEYGAAMIRGYNACLREVARLNQAPVSAGEPCECGGSPHTTECLYEHFLSYSQMTDHPLLRYAYFHGAHAECEKPSAGGVDERAAFEAWARKHNSSLSEDEIDQPEDINLDKQAGVYIWANAESAWMAWQARAALSAPSHGDQVRHMVPSWMASARAFVDRLHLAGWRDHADAQHAGVAGMYDELLAAPSAGSQGGDV